MNRPSMTIPAAARQFACLLALLFAAGGAMAQSTVFVRCSPTAPLTESNGFNIIENVVVFNEPGIVCGSGGNELPPPLDMVGYTVSAPTVDVGESVTVSGEFQNLRTEFDQCWVNATPQATGAQGRVVPVDNLATNLSQQISFLSTDVGGVWSLSLDCRRVINNQEVILANFPKTTTVTVTSPVLPNECDNLTPPLVSRSVVDYSAPYTNAQNGGFGVQPGSPTAHWFNLGSVNTYNQQGQLTGIGVRSFRFVAPENKLASHWIQSTASGAAMSISSQCGQFRNLPLSCVGAPSSTVTWTTMPGANPSAQCVLQPGQTYYVNFAYFNVIPHVLNNAAIESTCSVVGGCAGGHRITVPGQ